MVRDTRQDAGEGSSGTFTIKTPDTAKVLSTDNTFTDTEHRNQTTMKIEDKEQFCASEIATLRSDLDRRWEQSIKLADERAELVETYWEQPQAEQLRIDDRIENIDREQDGRDVTYFKLSQALEHAINRQRFLKGLIAGGEK